MVSVQSRRRGRPEDRALKQRRREEILEIAATCFAEAGYAGTDLQRIADQAGVGKGTVYRYFRNKEELFLAAVDGGMRRLNEQTLEFAGRATDPLEQMILAAFGYLQFFDRHPQYVELLIQERAFFRHRKHPTYSEHVAANIGPWREMLRGLVAAGRLRDVPVERTTDLLSDMLYGTMFTQYFAEPGAPLAERIRDIIEIIAGSILSPDEARSWDDARWRRVLELAHREPASSSPQKGDVPE